ncbi:hypothetical protein J2S40_002523 [Nocardioides luteus]|uniref:Lipoprotein n=1 Tax=Nocardioides luteus TaxID=1844 RepID=A0ABQ5T1G4_9ACTN|nr:hypothetical protein [Nocardioides luteus]MDR7311465.1 hypothetical protein [Nocardioides luteus]GGR55435.1 hypothetical protein GCM10010197_22570 [Nocardioides luteus]GLJ70115.1 hypothetical protein GCM10017579_41510 [Nocardioides luteus]
MRWWLSAPALILPLILTGCGSGQDEAVRESAADFNAAVSAKDWARACDLLAPETRGEVESAAKSPCTSALAEEDLPAPGALEQVDVFGTTAEVRYRGDTLFMTEFADGWHLLAAGCTPQPPKPYDCSVHGG